ncbi:MAG: hypothetical protein, partial [Olavius algarvensis Gamma 1 endosymbiont]
RMISLFPSKSTGYRLSFSAERRRVYRGRFPSSPCLPPWL